MKLHIGQQPANLPFNGDECPVFWEGSIDADSVADAKVLIYETKPCFNTSDIEFKIHNGILYAVKCGSMWDVKIIYKITGE